MDDDDDDDDDDALPVVLAVPGKTQEFAVYVYIYTYVHTLWGLRTFKNQQTLLGGATESDRWS